MSMEKVLKPLLEDLLKSIKESESELKQLVLGYINKKVKFLGESEERYQKIIEEFMDIIKRWKIEANGILIRKEYNKYILQFDDVKVFLMENNIIIQGTGKLCPYVENLLEMSKYFAPYLFEDKRISRIISEVLG